MRFISVALLVVVALACVYENVRVTRTRSLVPDAYDAQVVSKERRTEKHPGVDDVVLWRLDDGRTIQVAGEIDEVVPEGHRFKKRAGDWGLVVWDPRKNGDSPHLIHLATPGLTNTKDDRGMFLVAGPAILSTGLLAWAAIRRRRRAPPVA